MFTVQLEDKIKEIGGKPWTPVDVVRFNGQIIRLALFKGEYHWHKHIDEDEVFYVRPSITLHEGEFAVVPKGVEHCPKSPVDTYVLMIEPYSPRSKGD